MPRRGHKKSRAGCADCKRRHVKCDETRPACVNCKVACLTCSYLKSSKAQSVVSETTIQSTVDTPAYSPLTPDTSSVTNSRAEKPNRQSPGSEVINMDHLELLHHYENETYKSFTTNSQLAITFKETAVSHALHFPFLMYAILALSAVHLSKVHPDRAEHYSQLASRLQGMGLAGLDDNLLNINETNCVAMFIFATTIGLQSFCETFNFQHRNFNNFLEKLSSCIQLMRGVRSVLSGGWWEHLRMTSLGELFATGNMLGDRGVEKDRETGPLWELLDQADLSPASLETYKDAVIQLQRVFNAEARQENAERSISMVFAWPVMLNTEYNDLLIQRRPEALVILAFYAVILHKRRGAWAVSDSGLYLINSISEFLGKHWDRWLIWPKTVVSSTIDATGMITPD